MRSKPNSDSAKQLAVETGIRLKTARKAKGMTQGDMGKLFGMTAQGFAKYEKGNEMKATMIVKVCAILECPPEWLLGVETEGQQLPPEAPLLKDLKAAFALLNMDGQKDVVAYTQRMTRVPEFVLKLKSTRQDTAVSGIV